MSDDDFQAWTQEMGQEPVRIAGYEEHLADATARWAATHGGTHPNIADGSLARVKSYALGRAAGDAEIGRLESALRRHHTHLLAEDTTDLDKLPVGSIVQGTTGFSVGIKTADGRWSINGQMADGDAAHLAIQCGGFPIHIVNLN